MYFHMNFQHDANFIDNEYYGDVAVRESDGDYLYYLGHCLSSEEIEAVEQEFLDELAQHGIPDFILEDTQCIDIKKIAVELAKDEFYCLIEESGHFDIDVHEGDGGSVILMAVFTDKHRRDFAISLMKFKSAERSQSS